MPTDVHVRVIGQSPLLTGGISPPRPRFHGYFCGRTVVFTHHHAFAEPAPAGAPPADVHLGLVFRSTALEDMLDTCSHELGHAFGTPHKCGYFDWKVERTRTCTMNYNDHPMLEEETETSIVGSMERRGVEFCGRHLKVIRRTHLEDNNALEWR
jgi:hypothetical protein